MQSCDGPIRLCVFDLDHTLVRSDLDLDRVKRDVTAHLRRRGVAVPAGESPLPVAELVRVAAAHDACHGDSVTAEVWQIVTGHERRALAAARAEPGARETLAALRGRGCRVAVWTNNASSTAAEALDRAGLAGMVDIVVGRDEAGRLKPAPDGFAAVLRRLAAAGEGETPAAQAGPPEAAAEGKADLADPTLARRRAIVIGDSWIDGAAAAAAGVRFVAFRTPAAVFAARGVPVWRRVEFLPELLDLPGLAAAVRYG
ncbi:MAG TPA: HAD family hydrolase [Thermaerobacter sp.]